MKFFILLFFFVGILSAKNDYSLSFRSGKATLSDFSEILVGNWKGHVADLEVQSLDVGLNLNENNANRSIDIYLKAALSYYNEASLRDNNIGLSTYVKFYKNVDFLHNRVRFGFGEGVSYTSNILYTEYYEAKQESDNNSKFLNYLNVSIDFDVGRFLHVTRLKETYIGWTLEHRSGIFGLINNVRRGGSNYNTFSIEKNF